ncbi:unnamed protein product [Effrenium voratum]|uniref:Uncharacterized protein n=1 Tax=Effrenium voratum TaxID=2562239 RepID=A0AA36ILF2_9DINO|nr:unnamed protein product [Effrenium voratum]
MRCGEAKAECRLAILSAGQEQEVDITVLPRLGEGLVSGALLARGPTPCAFGTSDSGEWGLLARDDELVRCAAQRQREAEDVFLACQQSPSMSFSLTSVSESQHGSERRHVRGKAPGAAQREALEPHLDCDGSASRMRPAKPKKPSVEELLPLRLVGDFCSWQADVPGLELQANGSQVGGKVLEFFLPLEIQESSVEFQIISSPLGFQVRLYPKEGAGLLKADEKMGASEANALVGGSGDGHGRNFVIRDTKAKALLVRLALGKKGVAGPALAAQVSYAQKERQGFPTVQIGDGKIRVLSGDVGQVAWSSDPDSLKLKQLLPLRLVGQPCSWRLEQSGLTFADADKQGEWQGFSLCCRLLTRQVDFQVVSDKMGFGWRLFPEGGTARVPLTPEPHDAAVAAIGGKDDGSGQNFSLSGRPLSVVSITAWLKLDGERVLGARVGHASSNETPKVAIGARRVQYPVPAVMTPLGPELLEAAQTDEEREAATQQRNDCLRRAIWSIQREYAAEDVQQEVLALRQLYPYQQKKSILALEMEAGQQQEEQEEEDGVQSYVKAVQNLKRENAEEDGGAGAMQTEEAGEPRCEPSPEAGPKSAEEELRQHCLRGLAAVQRQVAQHSSEAKGSGELALMPQSYPSALAGALSMCEGDNLAAALAGARAAHLEQLKKQEKVLARALQPLEPESEEEGEENQVVDAGAALALLQKANLFGDTDAQFNSAVQNLPSVKAARERAMVAVGLPSNLGPVAARMAELLHHTDPQGRQANMLCLKRLRLLAVPHPEVIRRAAEALQKGGLMTFPPGSWFFGLEGQPQHFPLLMEDLHAAWNGGHFRHWFGSPRAGRYMTSTLQEIWSLGFKHLYESVVLLQDELQLILKEMGPAGSHLRVEQQVLISFHGKGQQMPPWEDGASRRSRRVSLLMNPGYSHRRVGEGGALRLHLKDGARGKNVQELPGGGGNWAVFRTPDVRQEVTKVNLPCGRWSLTVAAEDVEVARKLRPDEPQALATLGEQTMESHMAAREVSCAACSFSAGDGLLLSCPGNHRICRNCLLMELRRESVPSCPACAGEGDRIHLSSTWQLMTQEHGGLEQLGCCCTPGAEGCDSQVDVGAQVVIFGQSKRSGLNGQRSQALWWDVQQQVWEVLLPSRKVVALRPSELALSEACDGSNINNCPCWPSGRGIYPVSLGNRCCVKLGIDECSGDAHCPVGYPYFHGAEYLPFDSLLTSLDAVLFFLRHNFDNFFHYNDMIDVHPPGLERIIFHNYRSWMHAFPHHHPQLDQAKLDRRIRRFRVLCQHSRDVRGARCLQFVRYVGDAPHELHRIEELYSLLRLWGGAQSRLCYVAMLQAGVPKLPHLPNMPWSTSSPLWGISAPSLKRGRLLRHAKYPKVLFWLVEGIVDVMDFSPIREALRFNVYDEAGMLFDCPEVSTEELLQMLRPFKDPFTNKGPNCVRTWLERPADREKEVSYGFFPDCPRAQKADQGRSENRPLWQAVQRQDLAQARLALQANADANAWDTQGRRPLQELCEMAVAGKGGDATLQIAAELLLAHGDPRARDKKGATALDVCKRLAQQKAPFGPQLVALLRAVALEDFEQRALFRALGRLEKRSQVALHLLGLRPLRPVAAAEVAWRSPGPDLEEQLRRLDEELQALQGLAAAARRRGLRRLLFEWHPDKNSHRYELAQTMFQHLQHRKAELLGKKPG